jgi:hypothetical protein
MPALRMLGATLAAMLVDACPVAAQISGASVSITGATCSGGSSDTGDCRSSTQVLSNNGTTFSTRYAWNINADTGLGSTRDISGTARHNVSFTATAPGGYRLDIGTTRSGMVSRGSDYPNCWGSADTSGVTGTSNVALSSGTLSLADPGG